MINLEHLKLGAKKVEQVAEMRDFVKRIRAASVIGISTGERSLPIGDEKIREEIASPILNSAADLETSAIAILKAAIEGE